MMPGTGSVTVANATSGETVARYQYDGRGYRNCAQTFASGVLNEARNFYYSDQWQVLEEARQPERPGSAIRMGPALRGRPGVS